MKINLHALIKIMLAQVCDSRRQLFSDVQAWLLIFHIAQNFIGSFNPHLLNVTVIIVAEQFPQTLLLHTLFVSWFLHRLNISVRIDPGSI